MSKKNPHILIVDDAPDFHQHIRYAFRRNYSFEGAIGVKKLMDKLKDKPKFDLVLLDLVLEDDGEQIGLELIKDIQDSLPGIPIIVVTSNKDYKTAAESISRGAQYFLYKGDYNYDEWDKIFQKVIQQANLNVKVEKLERKVKELEVKVLQEYVQPPEYPIIGNSAQMETLRRSLKIAAEKPDLTVLITGETGTGKSIAAHFLHFNSTKRNKQAFEEIFISNIAETMLEAELFGAKKGSYTDLKEDRTGRLQLANKGIVFLDEIGDLDPNSQGKLLQFLQKKTIRPLGGDKDIELDVQIVAATNKIMKEEVDYGRFRKDLYERLKVFPIDIPPLRNRREDITDLMLHFLQLDNERDLQKRFTGEVLQILTNEYNWSGNVRELENAITYMKLRQELEGSSLINLECLPIEIKDFYQQKNKIQLAPKVEHSPSEVDEITNGTPDTSAWTLKEKQEFESLKEIERALKIKNGVKGDAAKHIGLNSSDDLRYRILKLRDEHPEWIPHFPKIQESYKKYLPN